MPRHRLAPALLLSAAALCSLTACGTDDAPTASVDVSRVSAAQEHPPAAQAAGFLGSIADLKLGERRLAYVDLDAAAAFGGPLTGRQIASLVLGDTGAKRAAGVDGAQLAGQVGAATVVAGAGGRRVIGATGDDARALASTTPDRSILAPETESATHSCLGNPVAEVILGPGTLGPTSAIGVSLLDTADAPAGRKLRICAAPHYVRELHAIEERLTEAFPTAVVAEEEIGEREIVGASIPLTTLDTPTLRDLLSGGPALLELAKG